MESLVHRISLEYRWTNPFQDKRKVANHEDEKSCVNFTDLEVDLRGLITSQGYIGSSPFKRVSYQTCGRRIHLCLSDFNLGPSSCHYVAMKIFFAALGLRPWVTSTAAAAMLCCAASSREQSSQQQAAAERGSSQQHTASWAATESSSSSSRAK